MKVEHLDHFTLSVAENRLPLLLDFYTRILQLHEGNRPAFSFAGHWLYAGGKAVVHLAGNEADGTPSTELRLPTGKLNHISFRTSGLRSTREHLAAHAVEWQEAPVPGFPLHQIFLRDPVGLKVELTFDAAELAEAGHRAVSE